MRINRLSMGLLPLFLAVLSLTPALAQRREALDIDVKLMQKLQIANMAIANLYVDSVDQGRLVEDAINGMLRNLDPHSSYSNAEETRKMNEPLEGNFEGIGVQFNMLEDTLVVVQTVSKGPSEKVGILSGDRIISVDGEPIAGVKMDRDSIMRKLRGPKDTKVMLGVVRRGVDHVLTFRVVRDKIPVNTLDAAYMIAPGIGYIHLDRFGATTADELRDKLKELKKDGMRDLILDLEMNGGGYLGAAISVANEFLQDEDLIVYTEGRNTPASYFRAKGGGMFTKGRLVILVDEYTASAAEIVSGAVQDHDRGTIVGRRTFGKGLVQRPIDLPDGSMIRLTVSHYYTPSGRCIQKPYTKGKKDDYDQDMENRYVHGELTCLDSVRLDSTKVYRTLRKGRTVYGGGGIMPDVFVPLDTTAYTPYLRAIRRNNLITDLMLRYVDGHRAELQRKYKKFDDFERSFEVPQELVDSILSQAKRKKIEPKDTAELEKTLPDLRFLMKSLIAYNAWDRNEYFRIINRRNDIVRKALEILSDEPEVQGKSTRKPAGASAAASSRQ